MATHTIKRGDLYPPIEATLADANGDVDLSGATVRFIMVDRRRTEKVNGACDVEDGTVSYQWSGSDTDTAGTFRAEFEVTFSDGRVATFPNESDIIVSIVPDRGDAPAA